MNRVHFFIMECTPGPDENSPPKLKPLDSVLRELAQLDSDIIVNRPRRSSTMESPPTPRTRLSFTRYAPQVLPELRRRPAAELIDEPPLKKKKITRDRSLRRL